MVECECEGTEGGEKEESFLREGRVRYGIECGRECDDDECELWSARKKKA